MAKFEITMDTEEKTLSIIKDGAAMNLDKDEVSIYVSKYKNSEGGYRCNVEIMDYEHKDGVSTTTTTRARKGAILEFLQKNI